jgi:hypothetical protein
MTDYISSVMNSGKGCLLIGVKQTNDNQFVAEGIQLTYKKRSQIFYKINEIRENNIFPHMQKR